VFGVGGVIGTAAAVGAPLCPTAALFGVPCPGCGLTRATLALFQGDLGAAFGLHPLVLVLAPIYVLGIGAAVVAYVRGAPQPGDETTIRTASCVTSRAFTYGAAALLALVVGVWGARFFGAFGGPVHVERIGLTTLRR
jgi:hypothetical protein